MPLDALLADEVFKRKRGRWSPKKLSVLRIVFDRKLRDVTRGQAIARAKVTRVELRMNCLLEVDSETELVRARQNAFYPWLTSRSMCLELV